MHHPLTWLRRRRPDRQRLAMMIQIIQQMLGKRPQIVPHVSFGAAISPQGRSVARAYPETASWDRRNAC